MKVVLIITFFVLLSCKTQIVESEGDIPIIKEETLGQESLYKENNVKPDIETEIPQCISQRIVEIKNGEIMNPPTVVTEITLNGKRYYVIPSGCCDQYDYIIDENCKIVCYEGVGFDGKFISTCGNGLYMAVGKVIWRDLR